MKSKGILTWLHNLNDVAIHSIISVRFHMEMILNMLSAPRKIGPPQLSAYGIIVLRKGFHKEQTTEWFTKDFPSASKRQKWTIKHWISWRVGNGIRPLFQALISHSLKRPKHTFKIKKRFNSTKSVTLALALSICKQFKWSLGGKQYYFRALILYNSTTVITYYHFYGCQVLSEVSGFLSQNDE